MNLDQKIGQMFFVGFDGAAASPPLASYLEELQPGGLIFFARNIESAEQVQDLCETLRRAVDPAPFIAVDQEGGRVSRLRPVLPPLPTAAALSGLDDDRIRAYARALGEALLALGFNTDFAPVVDLSPPGAANGIGDRSFGEDADLVVRCTRAFVAGLAEAGVASFLKHFPGLGATHVDSHVSLPVCTRSGPALWEHDLLPFRSCAREAAGVMVAHAHYPMFDPGRTIASSLSESIVTGLLRHRMGFDGIALTDDLDMGAVAGPAPGAAAQAALRAGNDMVMFCNDPARAVSAYRELLAETRAGRFDGAIVDRAAARVMAAKYRFGVLTSAEGARQTPAPQSFAAALEGLLPFATS